MSPRTSAQLQLHKENKKAAILEAALKVFAENGFAEATIDKIAKEAGIAKVLLYTYYSGKDDLLQALIRLGMDKTLTYISTNSSGAIRTKKEFEKSLRAMVGYFLKETRFWRLYILLALQSKVSARFQDEDKVFFEKYLAVYLDYFTKKKSSDPLAEARGVAAGLEGVRRELMMAPEGYPLEGVLKMIVIKFA